MDAWIQSILQSSESEKTFFSFLDKVEKNAHRLMQQALLKGDTIKAIGLAYEAKAYQTLKRTYKGQVQNQKQILESKEE